MSRLYWRRLLLDINNCVINKNRVGARALNTGCKLSNSSQAADKSNNEQVPESKSSTKGSISKAMQSYLERAQEHHVFMEEQRQEFILGRRHLANMMGKDPETFTQDDINEAIRYLFPSGLFVKHARPMMQPPEEIYPKQKAAQFDISGRPHHPFFYTAKPNFYYVVHEIMSKINKLNKIMSAPVENVEANSFLKGTKWISKDDLETRLLEKLSDDNYSAWVATLERLADHPHFYKELDFLKAYRLPLSDQNILAGLPPVTIEPDGRKCVVVENCGKKKARGTVTVRMPGTGLWKINEDYDLSFFKMIQSKEMVIAPLQLAGFLGQVDIEATVTQIKGHIEGETSYASLIRYGIAHGIVALGADIEPLRLAGYMTKDRRKKERSHVAHWGARAAHTWKKR